MLHRITVANSFIIIFSTAMLMMFLMTFSLVECKAIVQSNSIQEKNLHGDNVDNSKRQFLFLTGVGRETSTPDFIRLVIMRVIYGLASSMGVEERLEGLFNGAFVPPNADGDLFGLGGFGDGAADGGDFDAALFEGLFDDDAF